MLLDCGFFGTGEEYCWTLSADVYSPALATYLHTFQVNKMNTGNVNLGDHLVYKVFYANSKLYVFDTQQLTTYDYRGVQDTSGSQLIYGWRLMNHSLSARGTPQMLFAPTNQTSSEMVITELRVLAGSVDNHITLPTTCVGAAIDSRRIYAFSPHLPVHQHAGESAVCGIRRVAPGRAQRHLADWHHVRRIRHRNQRNRGVQHYAAAVN